MHVGFDSESKDLGFVLINFALRFLWFRLRDVGFVCDFALVKLQC